MMGTATRDMDERVQDGATTIEAPADGLGRYARWQLRDFVMQKAPILGILALLLMYPLVAGAWDVSPNLRQFAQEMRDKWIYVMFSILTPLGTLAATRGIVSEDRQQGFHRFLFAKPIRMVRYYAQQFAINFAGVMAVLAAVALLYAVVIGPFALLPAFVPAAVFFVLFGGVTFLFSTLSRYDWVWTLGTLAASAWVKLLVDDRGWSILRPLKALLLPLDAFGEMVVAWMKLTLGDGTVAAALGTTAWPLAYGAAAFAAGLWVLKKRSVVR
jgi:hypothetical protein